jgi:calcineurin-like phosphoesterase family protein
MTKVVCISDTHLRHPDDVPDGDVLVHAGDALQVGTVAEYHLFKAWFERLPHKVKIFVPGNHDEIFETNETMSVAQLPARVLMGYGPAWPVRVGDRELFVWGSPHQPEFGNFSFGHQRLGWFLNNHWSHIPPALDILVTHSPPYGILDQTSNGHRAGCESLAAAMAKMDPPPKLHIFGHIHEGYGIVERGKTIYVNASVCDQWYQPVNKIQVVEI